jgi:non-heme chloroperoxidase
MRSIAVKSPDGTTIAAFEGGNPAGPAILFLHGLMQCHLAWRRQFADSTLAATYRLIAMDLRGHGSSGKPVGKEHYRADRLWADDVAAVIEQLNLRRPVLVGWSYSGRVITDYLRVHGQGNVAGIDFVAANNRSDAALLGPAIQLIPAALSDDLAICIDGTRAFLHACFESKPSDEEFAFMLAYNMVVPPAVRAAVLAREANRGDLLATLTCPVLVSHGSKDPIMLPAMAEFTASQVKGARLSMYDGIGHSPFYEDTPRFNRELAEFVQAAQ